MSRAVKKTTKRELELGSGRKDGLFRQARPSGDTDSPKECKGASHADLRST